MYEEGTLRPPTAADMLRGQMELERIRVEHSSSCDQGRLSTPQCRLEWHVYTTSHVSPLELFRFCQDNGIPVQALLTSCGDSLELLLDWRHLD